LTKGRRLRCFGEVRQGVNTLEMVHPEYRSLEPSDKAPPVEPYLTPVYRTTEGVHQQTLRSLVTQALSLMERDGIRFSLTAAQRRVAEEIGRDLARAHPMQRLVQGDVGSGKTVVAVLAALQAAENGFQAAVMAPTELLAEQHYANFRQWLTPLGLEVAWLSGQLKPTERKEVLARLADGSARLAVGTHALFQEAVRFQRLGLVIIDEQHRFGVHQRLALREKGSGEEGHPHQLIMTATPIPRTLAMTAYADLDVSVIDELPPGRTPVTTVVVPDSRREEVIERVGGACRQGRQAYWVCTLVEESEVLTAQAAEDTAALLAGKLPDLTVGLIHGRMKPQEREPVMRAFKAGEIDLLVATTVIEVGVDVPNASLMIIENPERLGLAQLHQLRGRVGRGSHESSCVLMYHGALSEAAHQRLAVLRESCDGFVIAQRDLELRGPGELLGTRQTGMLRFRIADLQRDRGLLAGVARAAARILADYPRHRRREVFSTRRRLYANNTDCKMALFTSLAPRGGPAGDRALAAVRLLSQRWENPLPDEARLLGIRPKRHALVRQVLLLCKGEPWVYARTVIPRSTLSGRRRRFVRLGTRPLGAVLFADPSMQRSEVQVASLGPATRLYRLACRELEERPAVLWGRRSVFRLSDRPLLVSEIFLPAVGECPGKGR